MSPNTGTQPIGLCLRWTLAALVAVFAAGCPGLNDPALRPDDVSAPTDLPGPNDSGEDVPRDAGDLDALDAPDAVRDDTPDAAVKDLTDEDSTGDAPEDSAGDAPDDIVLDGGLTCDDALTPCAEACVDLARDRQNCGACGNVCPERAGGSPECRDGSCSTRCDENFADCDTDRENGCEVNLTSDVGHCGACGMGCEIRPHTATLCAAGRCAYTCSPSHEDCDRMPANGCEIDLAGDVRNCGSCGSTCAPRPNTTVACAGWACAWRCAEGFGDCDGQAANGCEVDLRASVSHCGACGMACPARPHMIASCVARTCAYQCEGQFLDCNGLRADGCEVDPRTDLTHCGSCTNSCTNVVFPHAPTVCVSGQCRPGTCDRGYAHCTSNPNDGCETDLVTSRSHCGRCGNACPASNVCDDRACVPFSQLCGSSAPGQSVCPPPQTGNCPANTTCMLPNLCTTNFGFETVSCSTGTLCSTTTPCVGGGYYARRARCGLYLIRTARCPAPRDDLSCPENSTCMTNGGSTSCSPAAGYLAIACATGLPCGSSCGNFYYERR